MELIEHNRLFTYPQWQGVVPLVRLLKPVATIHPMKNPRRPSHDGGGGHRNGRRRSVGRRNLSAAARLGSWNSFSFLFFKIFTDRLDVFLPQLTGIRQSSKQYNIYAGRMAWTLGQQTHPGPPRCLQATNPGFFHHAARESAQEFWRENRGPAVFRHPPIFNRQILPKLGPRVIPGRPLVSTNHYRPGLTFRREISGNRADQRPVRHRGHGKSRQTKRAPWVNDDFA